MWVATCRQCGARFTTIRTIDEHCPSCQPALAGLAPEQRRLFPEAAREADARRPDPGREGGPQSRITYFPKGINQPGATPAGSTRDV